MPSPNHWTAREFPIWLHSCLPTSSSKQSNDSPGFHDPGPSLTASFYLRCPPYFCMSDLYPTDPHSLTVSCMTTRKLFKPRVCMRLFPKTATAIPSILRALCIVTLPLPPCQFPFRLNLGWLCDICGPAECGGHGAMSLAASVFALWEEEQRSPGHPVGERGHVQDN